MIAHARTARLLLTAAKRAGVLTALGGPGSGNFGHAGRPGEVGGSSSDGGVPHDGTVSQAGLDHRFPKAGDSVDGRVVLKDVPNTGSIESSLNDHEVLPGIREVKVADFENSGKPTFYSSTEQMRTEQLAERIKSSGEIKPLIVVVDKEKSPYILEGGHRFDALKLIGAKSFPALVVIDTEELKINAAKPSPIVTAVNTATSKIQAVVLLAFSKGQSGVRETLARRLPDALTPGLLAGAKVGFSKVKSKKSLDISPDTKSWLSDHVATISDSIAETSKELVDPFTLDRAQRIAEHEAQHIVMRGQRFAWLQHYGVKTELKTASLPPIDVSTFASPNTYIPGTCDPTLELRTLSPQGREKDTGKFYVNLPKRTWIAQGDACPLCEELDGQSVQMDEDYDGPDGPVYGPPLHMNCQCEEDIAED